MPICSKSGQLPNAVPSTPAAASLVSGASIMAEVLEKKLRNLEKRKGKLEDLMQKRDSGQQLQREQTEALAKYDGVVLTLEFVRDLQKQFQCTALDSEECVDVENTQCSRQLEDRSRIIDILKLQSVLASWSSAQVRQDFVEGKNGAPAASAESIAQLSSLAQLMSLSLDDDWYFARLESTADHLLGYLDGSPGDNALPGAVNYRKVREIVDQMHAGEYFAGGKLQSDEVVNAAEAKVAERETKACSGCEEVEKEADASSVAASFSEVKSFPPAVSILSNGLFGSVSLAQRSDPRTTADASTQFLSKSTTKSKLYTKPASHLAEQLNSTKQLNPAEQLYPTEHQKPNELSNLMEQSKSAEKQKLTEQSKPATLAQVTVHSELVARPKPVIVCEPCTLGCDVCDEESGQELLSRGSRCDLRFPNSISSALSRGNYDFLQESEIVQHVTRSSDENGDTTVMPSTTAAHCCSVEVVTLPPCDIKTNAPCTSLSTEKVINLTNSTSRSAASVSAASNSAAASEVSTTTVAFVASSAADCSKSVASVDNTSRVNENRDLASDVKLSGAESAVAPPAANATALQPRACAEPYVLYQQPSIVMANSAYQGVGGGPYPMMYASVLCNAACGPLSHAYAVQPQGGVMQAPPYAMVPQMVPQVQGYASVAPVVSEYSSGAQANGYGAEVAGAPPGYPAVTQATGYSPIAYAPVSQASGYAPATQVIGYAPINQPNGYVPVTQANGYVPVTQINGYVPVSQPSGYIPATQSIGYAPVNQPSGYVPVTQVNGYTPNNQPSRYTSVSQSIGYAPATQTNGSNLVNQSGAFSPAIQSSGYIPATLPSLYVPATQANVCTPVAQTNRCAPVTLASEYTPITTASVYVPVTKASVYAPVTKASGYAPVTLASEYAPLIQASEYIPVIQASGYASVTEASRYAPVTQASEYAPVTQASRYAPPTRTSGTSLDVNASEFSPIPKADRYSGDTHQAPRYPKAAETQKYHKASDRGTASEYANDYANECADAAYSNEYVDAEVTEVSQDVQDTVDPRATIVNGVTYFGYQGGQVASESSDPNAKQSVDRQGVKGKLWSASRGNFPEFVPTLQYAAQAMNGSYTKYSDLNPFAREFTAGFNSSASSNQHGDQPVLADVMRPTHGQTVEEYDDGINDEFCYGYEPMPGEESSYGDYPSVDVRYNPDTYNGQCESGSGYNGYQRQSQQQSVDGPLDLSARSLARVNGGAAGIVQRVPGLNRFNKSFSDLGRPRLQ